MTEFEDGTIENIEFGASDYLANLQALKDNTVSKDEYAKLVADNKRLAQALANGDFGSHEESAKKQIISVDEAKAKLFNVTRKTDLQLFTEVLDLRDAVLNEGGNDPFLNVDPDHIPTEQEKLDADRIANNIRDAINYADGDPSIFRTEMMRRGGTR